MRDYLTGQRKDLSTDALTPVLPKGSDVLYFELADGTSFIVRPSGTEPKVKVYVLTKSPTREQTRENVERYTAFARELGGG
jgi:phosphoglucomutase